MYMVLSHGELSVNQVWLALGRIILLLIMEASHTKEASHARSLGVARAWQDN